MDFMDSEEDPIVYGIKLNEGVDLLFNHKDPRMPPGILQIFDSTLKKQDPTRLELGKRFKLLYAEYEL
jgi:hypothetical protein